MDTFITDEINRPCIRSSSLSMAERSMSDVHPAAADGASVLPLNSSFTKFVADDQTLFPFSEELTEGTQVINKISILRAIS